MTSPGISSALGPPRLSPLFAAGFLGLALAFAACKDAATQACQAELTNAQPVVKDVDGTSDASVRQALGAVQRALAACRKAGRTVESEQLARGEAELKARLETLAKRGPSRKRAALTPAQVDELVKKGDATCPLGMAYKAEGSDRQIRCTGPQPVRMGFAKAKQYFDGAGYHVTANERADELVAEYGAERWVFRYASPNDAGAPRCLLFYPAPGIPWQEAVARATGARLSKIKKDTPVPAPGGEVQLAVDESPNKLIVRLGDCG